MLRKHNIEVGWDVIGSDNKKIGSVKGCTDTYCHIDTGFLGLGPDYFVPMDAIYNVRPGEVVLNVRSDEVSRMSWEQVPAGAAATAHRPGTTARETTTGRPNVPGREPMTGRPGVVGREEAATTRESRSMPLREEELHAQRTRERIGEVEVTREIREEQQTIQVPVEHEDVVIRTHPATDATRPDGPFGEPETIRIPVSEERVRVTKEAHVYGEVEVDKERTVEEKRFTETVRKEVPKVSKKGEVSSRMVDEEKARNLTDEERARNLTPENRDNPRRDREP